MLNKTEHNCRLSELGFPPAESMFKAEALALARVQERRHAAGVGSHSLDIAAELDIAVAAVGGQSSGRPQSSAPSIREKFSQPSRLGNIPFDRSLGIDS